MCVSFYPDIEISITDAEEKEGFKIDSDTLAGWAIEKIQESDSDYDRQIAEVKNRIDALKEKVEKLEEQKQKKTLFLKSHLRLYMDSVKCKETKTRFSYKLLNGTLKLSKPSISLDKDDEVLLGCIESIGRTDLIKTKKSVDWSSLKKELNVDADTGIVSDSNGEILDGIGISMKQPEFSIDFVRGE